MSYSLSLNLKNRQAQTQKQTQHIIMSAKMQQALQMLQLPILELNALVEAEIEQNPILEHEGESEPDEELERIIESENDDHGEEESNQDAEMDFEGDNFEVLRRLDEDFRDQCSESDTFYSKRTAEDEKKQAFLEGNVLAKESLFVYLMNQAKETFDNPKDIAAAEALIGNFDANGFLGMALKEVSILSSIDAERLKRVLHQIQGFDPPGVGAFDLRDSLLIQLRCQNKEDTLAYQIIDHHFDSLVHHRIPAIAKAMGCTVVAVENAIDDDIAKLDMHPGIAHSTGTTQYIVPDISIHDEGEEGLVVTVNERDIPPLRLNMRYLEMAHDVTLPEETRTFIMQKLLSARWLMRNIMQRNDTLSRIAHALAVRQKAYLSDPAGQMTPLTMKELAEELELHESTIARAIANKYLDCGRGILPLRAFFTVAYASETGEEVSSNTVRDILKGIIDGEDREHPFSDEALSKQLNEKGIPCARRTIAKYRSEMGIGNTQQRRHY